MKVSRLVQIVTFVNLVCFTCIPLTTKSLIVTMMIEIFEFSSKLTIKIVHFANWQNFHFILLLLISNLIKFKYLLARYEYIIKTYLNEIFTSIILLV